MSTPGIPTTVADIKARLSRADEEEFRALERALAADPRKGVRHAVEVARRRLEAERAEEARLASLYEVEERWGGVRAVIGLDEVGRGPVAGPLTVGAVVLPPEPRIAGLNDSKQVSPARREEIASLVKEVALAWAVEHVPPAEIDERGMARCLRAAFARAVADVEAQGARVRTVLLDGNPLHLDPREVNVVKGDATCASIAAASIVAKVERDALMTAWAREYPAYGFDQNKGYASAEHIAAIKEHGLCPLHRATFCTVWTQVQESLF